MTRRRGSTCMKTRRTHGAIVCVCGDLKCTFSTTTVTHMLKRRRGYSTDAIGTGRDRTDAERLPERVEDHSEEHELPEQRDDQRRRRNDLRQQQEEHGQ